jgi:hypothetical protein
MKLNLGKLRIERIIAHEVPKKGFDSSENDLVLSEVDSPLSQMNKNFFNERITRSLSNSAFDVVPDFSSTSPLPNLIFETLTENTSDFVKSTQIMARHLYSCQNRVNPQGLLTVVQGTMENQKVLVILKLEKEEGIRVHQENIKGNLTFSIEHFSDLLMTDGTKVFKIGIFFAQGNDINSLAGRLSDKQTGYGTDSEVANFFLGRFLGFKLRESPEIATKNFFYTTEEFINRVIEDPQAKAQYSIALIASMGNQETSINPKTFAEKNLEISDRKKFLDYLVERQVDTYEFNKDINRIKKHIRRVQMEFQSGILLLGSPTALDEQTKITEAQDGKIRVEIEDKLKSTVGK